MPATGTDNTIAFYFDILSPFAYLASHRIDDIAAKHGCKTDWRPVLVGVTVMKIMGMKPLMDYPLKGPYLRRDAERIARLWNIPFHFHGLKGHNSLNAMRAYVWLKQRDPDIAKQFAKAMYRRLWVDGLDITPVEACMEEAQKIGIDPDDLRTAITSDDIKKLLQTSVEGAIGNGVFGVPFFIVDNEPFFGCDHLPMLEHWLQHGTWDRG
jgi:2-hydroxychromene-2-carboxylate isomerase